MGVRFMVIKGKNRSHSFYLCDLETGEKAFEVVTKRLIDRLTRNIEEVKTQYTIESFKYIYDATNMSEHLKDSIAHHFQIKQMYSTQTQHKCN